MYLLKLVPSLLHPLFTVNQSNYGMQEERGHLGADLKFAGLGHVFDAFERFVLLAIHVQPVYFQTCRVRKRRATCQS